MRIIIECPENTLHLEAGYIYADLSFVDFKPLAVWQRTIHFANQELDSLGQRARLHSVIMLAGDAITPSGRAVSAARANAPRSRQLQTN